MNQIIAAGGVVWRTFKNKDEIALIYRPYYNDWSFPKGKVEYAESLICTATREIYEETGITVQLGRYLGLIKYFMPTAEKVVHYWSAEAMSSTDSFEANEEVQYLKWLSVDSADDLLTRNSDKEILARFTMSEYRTVPLIFLCHGQVLPPEEWHGHDNDRPLANIEELESEKLFDHLAPYSIQEIYSSDAIHCLQTIKNLANSSQIDISIRKALSEYKFQKKCKKTVKTFKKLIKIVKKTGKSTLICSHQSIFAHLLKILSKKYKYVNIDQQLEPLDSLVLHMRNKKIIQIDHLSAPSVSI